MSKATDFAPELRLRRLITLSAMVGELRTLEEADHLLTRLSPPDLELLTAACIQRGGLKPASVHIGNDGKRDGSPLTTSEAAAELGIVDVRTMANWLEGGHFPNAYQSDGRWWFPRADVCAMQRYVRELQAKNDARDMMPPQAEGEDASLATEPSARAARDTSNEPTLEVLCEAELRPVDVAAAMRWLNTEHYGHETLPLDVQCSDAHQSAHASVNRVRRLLLTCVMDREGNLSCSTGQEERDAVVASARTQARQLAVLRSVEATTQSRTLEVFAQLVAARGHRAREGGEPDHGEG